MMTILALALSVMGGLGQVAEPSPAPMRLCLSVSQYGRVDGFANFAYSGRVSGSDPHQHYGYWVVAIDGGGEHAGGAAWAQNGGGVRGDGGRVRFGVHNGSQYPLAFVVRRILSSEDFAELRRTARLGNALTEEQLSRFPRVSAPAACQFELAGDPVDGVPTNHGNSCSCS